MTLAKILGYVPKAKYDALLQQLNNARADLQSAETARDQALHEANDWRLGAARELENGERLTLLAARAVRSAEILERTLVERQIGILAQGKAGSVVVVDNLKEVKNKQHGYVPLRKRRRQAAARESDAQVRRNALPQIKAELPAIPMTQADRDAMRETIELVEKETV